MAKSVRLEDIAQACGVTKGLVSRALAGKYNVGDETRNRIVKKAVELGYDFSKLRTKENAKKSVAIIVSSAIFTKEDYWQPIIRHMYATLDHASIGVEYHVFDENNIDLNAIRALEENPCMAFIFLHSNPDSIYRELRRFHKPIIEFDPKYLHYADVTQIKFSNYTSIYEATQRLIDMGHTHLCFYGSDMHALSFRERHEGFLSCLEKNKGRGIKGYSVIFDNSTFQYGDNAMLESALKENPDITAILCANDIVALNAYKVIEKMGKRIPENYSLVGFDNVRASRESYPSLTTFNVPREQVGDEIGRYIIRLIQAELPEYSEIIIRCSFVERESIRPLGDAYVKID